MKTVVASFAQAAGNHPRRVAVFWGDQKIRYADLDRTAARYAAQLQQTQAIGQGDRVGILLKNCPEFIYSLYAILRCGAVVVPINSFLKTREVQHIASDCQLKCLITSPDFEQTIQALQGPRLVPLADLEAADASPTTLPVPGGLADTAVIIYTSGTTGKPKGAVLTHGNLAANVASCLDALDETAADRMTLLLPMFHSFMLTVCIFTPLSMGASIVLIKSVQPFKLVLKEILWRRATIFVGIPQIFQAMAQQRLPWWVHRLLRLRMAISGSAPLPRETLEAFGRQFRFPLLEGYGLSEAAPVVSFNPIRGVRKPGSVGLPIRDVEVKVFDDDGHDLPAGQVGEIVVRGPNVMNEYYHHPEETATTLRHGWLHTGDMGKLDEDGYIYIVDRRKEMLLVRGMNVYPREIEEVLYQFPQVREAAVVARPDEKRGEAPVAFVSGEEASNLDVQAILRFCRENLADYKVPKEVRVMEHLPRTATGKIAKLELKKLLG